MNALEKLLAKISMSSERYDKLSAAEQTQLTTLSDSMEASETARADAETALATANESITALTTANGQQADDIVAHLATIEAHAATIATHEATISTQTETITAHVATIAELKAELDKMPGATETKVIKGAEGQPGEKTRKKRSWEED